MINDKMLSKNDVCEILNISQATLDRIVLDGMLPVYRVRGQCRFRRCDVNEYLDACREEHRPVSFKLPKVYRRPIAAQEKLPPVYVPGMKVV